MVTHDPVVARLADRRIDLHHGRIASQQIFSIEEEQQFDEVLEEIWILKENNELAELGRMQVEGALPVSIAIEKMLALGLVQARPHAGFKQHSHKQVLNRCHELVHPDADAGVDHGETVVDFTERGQRRAESVIRRHRLAPGCASASPRILMEQVKDCHLISAGPEPTCPASHGSG